jgi:NAD(P)-dependent dehydrogenase (short-subunit alcohol dehydrogenase family)
VTAGITGATRVYLHLAHPSAHARTPQVMNAEFARRGVDAVAVSADVTPADLGGFARGLCGWRNLAGLSVTMPHKEALTAHVGELIGAAALIGAVNVVRRKSHGRLVGANTDGQGFVIGLHKAGHKLVTRAFPPQLAEHEQSAILNVLSVLSWVSLPNIGAYCAAKAAEWSLTNALRAELAPQRTRVSSLHVAYMDTDMARHVTEPKSDPADIARIALDGIEAGETEIVADEISKQVLAGLSAGVRGLYPQVA